MSGLNARALAWWVARFGSPWPAMAGVNVAILLALVAYRLQSSRHMEIPYLHLLATYEFGFARRSLIGSVVALFTDRVSPELVLIIALTAWAVAAALLALAFVRAFGRSRAALPLAVFIFGSPMVLKNFIYTLGYFDIYGCIVALIALTLPVTTLALALIGALCVLLVLIHHVHTLLYVPTIAGIVLLRYVAAAPLSATRIAVGLVAGAAVTVTFVAAMFFGDPGVSSDRLIAHFQSRATHPIVREQIVIWYSTLRNELLQSYYVLPKNLLRVPIWILVVLAHLPLFRFFREMVGDLRERAQRIIVVAAIAGISLGYVIVVIVTFDWSRWVSNWYVCMVLLMLATAALPRRTRDTRLIPHDDPAVVALGWTVTILPRVGITIPF
ncbi:MAG: hypothetical protein IT536_00400 [Hyphomicrobiales bacterium]|nr:hypothetical protein [Hyphomicrobiales bacterium]